MACRVINFVRFSHWKKNPQEIAKTWSCKSQRSLCSHKSDNDSLSNKDNPEQNETDAVTQKKKLESDDPDNDKKRIAKEKLASLLSEIKVYGSKESETRHSLNLAKPSQRINTRKHSKREETQENDTLNIEENLILAVKDVASNATADHSKEIETELIKGIVSVGITKEVDNVMPKPNADVEGEMEGNLMSAVKAVASTVVDDPEYVQSDLTKKLLALTFQNESGSKKSNEKESMMGLFEGFKVEKSQDTAPSVAKHSYEHQHPTASHVPQQRPTKPKRELLQTIDIFGSPPLGIFNVPVDELKGQRSPPKSLLWDKLNERELKTLVQFSPDNQFEEMIYLTEQGKHWKFPIDNEIDMGAEENIGFHEHVFLDDLLKGFPEKGPIRHFMELVITGLSKNPHITVERKQENVEWFRQYFETHRNLLQDYGM